MALFFISMLSLLILFFLTSLAMQAIRMERAIERINGFVEQKVKAKIHEMQDAE